MSRPSVDWNEFRIDLLKTEWAAGIPMQDIAQHIGGGCTKADVGRKAKALNLGHHPSSPIGRRNKQRNSDPQVESDAQQLLESMERSAFQPPPPPAKANTKGGKGKEKPTRTHHGKQRGVVPLPLALWQSAVQGKFPFLR